MARDANLMYARACGSVPFVVQLRRFTAFHVTAGAKRERQGRIGSIVFGALMVLASYKAFQWLRRFFDADLTFADSEEWIAVLLFVGCVMVPIALLGLERIKAWSTADRDEHERAAQVVDFCRHLAVDLHPRARLGGMLYMGEASHEKAYRTATSSASKAKKTYHRLPWFALRGVLADGVRFSLVVTDVLQVKAGAERKRRHKVRVQMRLPTAELRSYVGKTTSDISCQTVGSDTVVTCRSEGDYLAPMLMKLTHLHTWITAQRVSAGAGGGRR